MSGAGDDVGVEAGVGVKTGGDEAGIVSHVDQEERAHAVGDFTEAGKVDDAGVGGGSGDDHFGLVLFGEAFDFAVVDGFVGVLDMVADEVVHFAREIEGVAMGEVNG